MWYVLELLPSGVISTGVGDDVGSVKSVLSVNMLINTLLCAVTTGTSGSGAPSIWIAPLCSDDGGTAGCRDDEDADCARRESERREDGKGKSTGPCETAHVCTSSVSEIVPDGIHVATACKCFYRRKKCSEISRS